MVLRDSLIPGDKWRQRYLGLHGDTGWSGGLVWPTQLTGKKWSKMAAINFRAIDAVDFS